MDYAAEINRRLARATELSQENDRHLQAVRDNQAEAWSLLEELTAIRHRMQRELEESEREAVEDEIEAITLLFE